MEAIVFGGAHSLDFPEVRSAVARIPEVAARIREAQRAWDLEVGDDNCLFHQLAVNDQKNYIHRNIKTVLSVAIQLGLYDRHLSKHKAPEFIVGDVQNYSAVSVAAKVKTIKELVHDLVVLKEPAQAGELPVLNGSQFPIFQVFGRKGDAYEALDLRDQGLNKLLPKLASENSVKNLISIGPGPLELSKDLEYGVLSGVVCLESIDMDPMLTWFWPAVRGSSASA